MSDLSASPPRWFWIVSVLALIWNLLGVWAYIAHVTMTPETLASLSEAQRALIAEYPAWVVGAWAISVFAGALGCIALLLRQRWAFGVLVISLLAVLIQFGWGFFASRMVELMGPSAVIMPLLIIVIAVLLVWFARSAGQKAWLR